MLTSFPLPLAILRYATLGASTSPYALRSIVRLTTDDGCVGWGETYGGEDILRKLQGAASLVKGLDPALFNRLRILINNPPVFAAYETAMLDLLGKAGGRPVCDVLGGKVRDTVPYSAYLFYKYAGDDEWGEAMSPEQLVAQAETFVERYGFETLKLKGGVLPPEAEAETMRQLRERFPQHQLRIDPNAIWSVETSIRFAGWVEDLDLEYYEDPAPDLAGHGGRGAGNADPAGNKYGRNCLHPYRSLCPDGCGAGGAGRPPPLGWDAGVAHAGQDLRDLSPRHLPTQQQPHRNLAGGNDSLGRGQRQI